MKTKIKNIVRSASELEVLVFSTSIVFSVLFLLRGLLFGELNELIGAILVPLLLLINFFVFGFIKEVKGNSSGLQTICYNLMTAIITFGACFNVTQTITIFIAVGVGFLLAFSVNKLSEFLYKTVRHKIDNW